MNENVKDIEYCSVSCLTNVRYTWHNTSCCSFERDWCALVTTSAICYLIFTSMPNRVRQLASAHIAKSQCEGVEEVQFP